MKCQLIRYLEVVVVSRAHKTNYNIAADYMHLNTTYGTDCSGL